MALSGRRYADFAERTALVDGMRPTTVRRHGNGGRNRIYIIGASVLTGARLQMGQRGFGTSYFGEENFPAEIRVDTTDASNPSLELTHRTRDDREGDRIVRDRIRLI
jgi:hypothetical protein